MGNELASVKARIHEAFKQHGRGASLVKSVIKILIIVASAVLVVVPFLSDSFINKWDYIGILSAIIIAVFTVILFFGEPDPTEKLMDGYHAITMAEMEMGEKYRLQNELSDSESYKEKLSQLYLALLDGIEIVELFSSDKVVISLSEKLSVLLSTIGDNLVDTMGFKYTDIWTICVYEAAGDVELSRELTLLAHHRYKKCDIANARKFPEGVGLPGICLSSCQEIVVADLNDPLARSVFALPPDLQRERDGINYGSGVAVPVFVGSGLFAWGVVVATSNQPMHFEDFSEEGVRRSEAARALARLVALLVSRNIPADHRKSEHDQSA